MFTPGIVSCMTVAGTLALCFRSSFHSRSATLHGLSLSVPRILRRMSGSADPSWAQQDKRRVLVIDIRVQNIEHTQQFYEQHLGMRLWRRLGDLQQGQFTSVCGYGTNSLLVRMTMASLCKHKVTFCRHWHPVLWLQHLMAMQRDADMHAMSTQFTVHH